MTTAFEQAANQAAEEGGAPAYREPQAYTPPAATASSAASQGCQLFGGATLPSSLLNRSHQLGTERHGVIKRAPYDSHSRDFNSRQPKYWANSPVVGANGRPSKITTDPIDRVTGEKLRPVLDTVIELDTDYRFNAAESAVVQRDPNLPDDGTRAFYASGDDLKQIRTEVRRLGLTSAEAMVGVKFSVARVGQKPNSGASPSWINKIELSR